MGNILCNDVHDKYTLCNKNHHCLPRVSSRYNLHSDWLIQGHYSPVIPTCRLQACKSIDVLFMI